MTAIAIVIMRAPTAPRIATTELLEAVGVESCDFYALSRNMLATMTSTLSVETCLADVLVILLLSS